MLLGAVLFHRRRKLKRHRTSSFKALNKGVDHDGDLLFTSAVPCTVSSQGYIAPAVVSAQQPNTGGRSKRSTVFTVAQLERATDGFAPRNKLAEGAFGMVFKGHHNGHAVAIKVLTRQDDPNAKPSDYSGAGSFALEAKVLGHHRHANIVGLLGHCLGPEQPQQFLVYEFMAGGSLKERLEASSRRAPLSWEERFVIASDSARALEYLHTDADPPIIHQDVKVGKL